MVRHIIAALEPLKSNPAAFALVVVNLLFLAWGAYMFNQFAKAGERRDTMLTAIIRECAK
jgi:hypothetical protein